MKNLLGIAFVASVLFSCNDATNQKSQEATNAALQNELVQAKHETELLKLNYEIELLKAQNGVAQSLAANGTPNAYLGTPLPANARATQQVDNEWTSGSSTDAYKPVKTVPVAETKKKKGMSTPVKGALIGAGVGAATGAIASKNHRVKGAVIGAVVGAGAGAVTGVVIDKKKQKAASTPDYAFTSLLN